MDDADEITHILVDALSLKKLAVDYAHPEFGVVNTDVRICITGVLTVPMQDQAE